MEQEVLKLAASQGLWAMLFVVLLFWVLKENARRESKYQELLSELTSKFGVLEDVKEKIDRMAYGTLDEIKTTLGRLAQKLIGG